MKFAKAIVIILIVYAGVVVIFESLLGYFQPGGQGTLVITTTNERGQSADRVLAELRSSKQLYVAANHWPRDWYRHALAHPKVEVTIGEEKESYMAVELDDAEHDRVNTEHALPFVFRILTGFPPRYILRLDPR